MNVATAHSQSSTGEQTAISGVVAGLVDTLVTVGAMIAANSSVLVADGLKTFLEFLAVLLSWLTLRRIHRGGHHSFDYGLNKLEDFASLLVAVLMLVCLGIIVINSAISLCHPSHIHGAGIWVSMGAEIIYVFINGWLFRKNQRLTTTNDSPIFQAQARLFLTKAIANAFILGSLLSSVVLREQSWSMYIDPIASLVIAASILAPAVGIFSHAFYDLLDRTLEESDKLKIVGEVGQFAAEFVDLHQIRTRRAGSIIFVDIVLEFDANRRMGDVHGIIEQLRDRIQKVIPSSHVTISLGGIPA